MQKSIAFYPGAPVSSDGARITFSLALQVADEARELDDPPAIYGPCISVAGVTEVPTVSIEGIDLNTCIEVRAANFSIANSKLRPHANGRADVAIKLARSRQAKLDNVEIAGFATGVQSTDAFLTIRESKITDIENGIILSESERPDHRKIELASVHIEGKSGRGTGVRVERGVRGSVSIADSSISSFAFGVDSLSPVSIREYSRITDNVVGIRFSSGNVRLKLTAREEYHYEVNNVALKNTTDLQIGSSLPDLALSGSTWLSGVTVLSKDTKISRCAINWSGLGDREMRRLRGACLTTVDGTTGNR